MMRDRMAGFFSRLSGVKGAHLTTQSTTETREEPKDVEIGGIEVGIDFRPLEHPIEPISLDHPVRCPLPDTSILNDGRIWKARMSASSAQTRPDLLVHPGKHDGGRRYKSAPRSRPFFPSISSPEHQIFKLLKERNAVGGQTTCN